MTNPEERAHEEAEVQAAVNEDRVLSRILNLVKTGRDIALTHRDVEKTHGILQEIKKLMPTLAQDVKDEIAESAAAEEARKREKKEPSLVKEDSISELKVEARMLTLLKNISSKLNLLSAGKGSEKDLDFVNQGMNALIMSTDMLNDLERKKIKAEEIEKMKGRDTKNKVRDMMKKELNAVQRLNMLIQSANKEIISKDYKKARNSIIDAWRLVGILERINSKEIRLS